LLHGLLLGLATAASLHAAPDALQALRDVNGHLCVVVARQELDLAPQLGGVLASIDADLGDRFTRGQVLFRLDSTALRHEAAVQRAAVQSAEAEVARARLAGELAARRAARRTTAADVFTSEEMETARSEADMAAAALQASEAQRSEQQARLALLEANLDHTQVTAPFAGAVATRYQNVGATVASGTPVLHLLCSGAPYVRFAVPPAEAAHYAPGTEVDVRFPGLTSAVRARVLRAAPDVDPAIDMVLVEAELQVESGASSAVRAGMVGKVCR
jgi:RND family efflux transporter MFP subunit